MIFQIHTSNVNIMQSTKQSKDALSSVQYIQSTFVFLLSILVYLNFVNADSPPSISYPPSLPRSRPGSTARRTYNGLPWITSEFIDDNGFITGLYSCVPGDWESQIRLRTKYTTGVPVRIRQVPGDGNCLFHSLSLALRYAVNGTHWSMPDDLNELYEHSRQLRQQAVNVLQSSGKTLLLQGRERLLARELVQAAAQQYGLTPQEYCDAMRQEYVWGGGPEIVALCNYWQRPIHVYELACRADQFVLRRMACFGSPTWDHKGSALHILSADSKFPDIEPGQQLQSGNHFLALFPVEDVEGGRRKSVLRGGAHNKDHHSSARNYLDDYAADMSDEDMEDCGWWKRAWQKLCKFIE